MREPRERFVARGHARGHAVDVRVILDVIPQRRRREAEAARRRDEARCRPHTRLLNGSGLIEPFWASRMRSRM